MFLNSFQGQWFVGEMEFECHNQTYKLEEYKFKNPSPPKDPNLDDSAYQDKAQHILLTKNHLEEDDCGMLDDDFCTPLVIESTYPERLEKSETGLSIVK